MDIGPTELIIILIIVILVFGVGRVGKLGGELGNSIREFRHGLGGDKDKPDEAAKVPEAAGQPTVAAVTPVTDAKPAETPKG